MVNIDEVKIAIVGQGPVQRKEKMVTGLLGAQDQDGVKTMLWRHDGVSMQIDGVNGVRLQEEAGVNNHFPGAQELVWFSIHV